MTIKEEVNEKEDFTAVPTAPYENVEDKLPVMMAEPVSSDSLLDTKTIDLLQNTNSFIIQQQIRWAEAITQGCIEEKNRYHVYDKETNSKIMVIKEESPNWSRCCCKPTHSLFAEFYHVEGEDDIADSPFMTMEREGCDCCCDECPKPLLCCFSCTEGCSEQSNLYAGPITGKPGEMKGAKRKNQLGETVQPIGGGGFKPVLQVMDRGTDKAQSETFAAVRGPCFFGGCSELCCNTSFGMSVAKDGTSVSEIHALNFGDFATIKKLKPKSFQQGLREIFTDADIYEVSFKSDTVTPQQKANVLASMIHLDYMFFERDNDMVYCRDNALHINLCNCFIYGCVCPCEIVIQNKN